jgi:hypothetical protein
MTSAIPSPAREAFTLPLALLTIAFAGGARLSVEGSVRFEAPPMIALVLAALLVGLMTRAGAVVPGRLFAPHRSGLENASGAVVFVALFAATTQVFHLLTPVRGLPNLFVNVLFLALLLNTFARRTDRRHLLGSLGVMFGSALLFKFVVLDALASPGGGGRRLFAATLEGLTLGALGLEPQPLAIGYLAFAVTTMYLVALWWLPGDDRVELIRVRDAELLTNAEVTLLEASDEHGLRR